MSKVSADLVRDKLALTLGELAIAVPVASAATYGVYKGVKALRNRKKAKTRGAADRCGSKYWHISKCY